MLPLLQMGAARAVLTSRGTHAAQWVRAVVFFAGAMACASMHRVTFSVLAIPIREEFALSLPQMGILQSAVLAGYIIGQVGHGRPPLRMLCGPCVWSEA